MAMVVWILVASVVILYLVYLLTRRKYSYWEKRKVPHLKPATLFGNYGEYISLRKYVGQVSKEISEQFPNEPYVGTFYGTEPALLLLSPELIKLVTTKDFYYFSSREVAKYTHKEVMTQNLFFTYGDRWRIVRQNFSPLFSSAKMRNMFHLIEKCSHVFENLLDVTTKTSNVVEVRSLMVRFTMDCIGSCAFGVETNAMLDDKGNPFIKMGDYIFEISNVRGFSLISRAIWPAIFYGLGFKTFPKELDDFFNKLIIDVFKSRNYEPSARNDFIDLIIHLKKKNFLHGEGIENLKTGAGTKISLKVDDELLVAQCLTFFAAGFETSATTSSFTLYELAKNKEAQQRAIDDVDRYLKKHDNKIGYDVVTEVPYLEACIDEALRLYPVLPVLTRELVEDYTLPTGVHLDKEMRVHIPVYALHRNPEYFPEPDEYRPERFLAENKKDIKPYTYMPFGEGPRLCIGMRFAKMQMLAGLVTILKKYRVELGDNTPRKMVFEPRSIVTQPKGGLFLKLVPRDGWENRVFTE